MTELTTEMLRTVCAANINGISIYDDVVQVSGSRNDGDDLVLEFPSAGLTTQAIAEHFGVSYDDIIDDRTKP